MNQAPTPHNHRAFIVGLLVTALLSAAFFLIRSTFFEQRNLAEEYISQAAFENPLLAASRLLTQRGYKIKQVDVFDKALSRHLPAGTLYLNDVGGDFENGQFKDVMQWVERGNTLIYRPRDSGKTLELTPQQTCEYQLNKELTSPLDDDDDADLSPVADKPDAANATVRLAARSATNAADDGNDRNDGAGQSTAQEAQTGQQPGTGDSDSGNDSEPASSTATSPATAKTPGESDSDSAADEADASRAPETGDTPEKKMLNSDPISRELGLELRRLVVKQPKPAPDASASANNKPGTAKKVRKVLRPCLASLTWPGSNYALELEHRYALVSDDGVNLLFADKDRHSVRVFQHGKGHIVALAQPYFTNYALPRLDHAELLLHLVSLQKDQRNFTIVQQLKRQTWFQKLWNTFHLSLITLGLGLVLLLWIALRRFGSVLPMPEPNRRALLEHIDASSRWLWKMPGGRDILLNAARSSTLKILQRRAPAIMRLAEAEQIAQLSATCSINRPDLVLALSSAAAPTPLLFMRQIKTLQRLRKHYER
jgi:hypothetical protein